MNTLNPAARRQVNRRVFLHAGMTGFFTMLLARNAHALTDLYAHNVYTGVAAGGYDVISYFLDGTPSPGDPEIEVSWADSYWRFVSPANADAFRDAPLVYAPNFGGYGLLGVARGEPQIGDPTIFRIYRDRLYFFHSPADQALFDGDPPKYIALAKENWPKVMNLLGR